MDTLVICTHNPVPAFFERALTSVLAAAAHAGDCEIIVVDNASDPPVASLVGDGRPSVRVVMEPQLGLTAARRRAAMEARGDLVVFVDDDNVLASNFVVAARGLFADATVGVLSGRVLPEYVTAPAAWVKHFELWLAIRRVPHDKTVLHRGLPYADDYPIGAGCVVRREVLRRYFADAESAGWIEGRRGADLLAGEDTDLAVFAVMDGFAVGTSPLLESVHIIPPRRTEVDYLLRLTEGSIRSAVGVQRKWAVRSGVSVFPYFERPLWSVQAKSVAYRCLAFLPQYRIRANQQATLLECARNLRSAARMDT